MRNINLKVPDRDTKPGTDTIRTDALEIFPEIKPGDVVITYLPIGELSSVINPEYELVSGGVVGVEGHTDLPEYVEDDEAAADPTYMDPTCSEILRSRAKSEFGIDLSSMTFTSFSYLWSTNGDDLPEVHEPLKTMLMDEVLVSHPGEGTPDGVYHDGEDAYVVRGIGNDQIRLVHCRIGGSSDWVQGQEDEGSRVFNGNNYTVVSVQDSE